MSVFDFDQGSHLKVTLTVSAYNSYGVRVFNQEDDVIILPVNTRQECFDISGEIKKAILQSKGGGKGWSCKQGVMHCACSTSGGGPGSPPRCDNAVANV